MAGAATILHADLDSFYAAVEVRRDPSLRGRPVAVGGGVVVAATYEAKRHGVTAGMPAGEARRRCPGLVFAPAHFDEYVATSRVVMEIFERFTPLVEPISIDEAFLQVAGTVHLFGEPAAIGRQIREAVRAETALAVSVGVASTKHLAKIASRVAKPDGLVVVPEGEEEAFLHPLPVELLWGVGPVGRARLASYGVHTIGDLVSLPPRTLASWMGDHWGPHLLDLAHNVDPRDVVTHRRAGSLGAQSAGDASDLDQRHRTLLALAERIGTRLRRKQMAGRTVTVRVRFGDMTAVTRAHTLPGPIAETQAIYDQASRLADALIAERAEGRRISLVGISVSMLAKVPDVQLELPLEGLPEAAAVRAGSRDNLRLADLDAAVDRARARFGKDAVRRAALLGREPEVRSPTDRLDEAGD